MKTRLLIIIPIIISSAMLVSFADWGFYGKCFEEGMVPFLTNADRACTQFENIIPQAFADNEKIIPSPLKQVKLGVKIGLIICDEDKILIYNVHYKPACVFKETEQKLIDRGWAKLRLLLPASPFPENEMELTGRNVMSMMLEGTVTISENRLETIDEKRKAVWEYAQQYYPGKTFLEYSIILPGERHYDIGEQIAFDLLEWGNYSECWDLKLRIFDIHEEVLYDDTLNEGCLEPLGTPGTFNSYSIGKDFELVCEKPGYYMIEVSNGEIYPPTILQNFACLDRESEDGYGLPNLSDPNRFTNSEPDGYSGWRTDEDYCSEWCDQNELYSLGCDNPILQHLTKFSNLLDEEFDGVYAIEEIGLPDGVTQEKFEECVDFIYEKRTSIEIEYIRDGPNDCHYIVGNITHGCSVITDPNLNSELSCEEICGVEENEN